jgi:hypothetical protein
MVAVAATPFVTVTGPDPVVGANEQIGAALTIGLTDKHESVTCPV